VSESLLPPRTPAHAGQHGNHGPGSTSMMHSLVACYLTIANAGLGAGAPFVALLVAAIGIADGDGTRRGQHASRRYRAGPPGRCRSTRHVANREQLLDSMTEAVNSEVELPARPSGDQRQNLALLAQAQRRAMRAHP
jgi:hypothetical protein